MRENVRTDIREDGDDLVLTKSIDDLPFREHCHEMRKQIGKGIIRNAKGDAQARHLLSIPVEEAIMLQETKDRDWLEWWHTDSNKSFMRLVQRFPHWVVCEGGGLV